MAGIPSDNSASELRISVVPNPTGAAPEIRYREMLSQDPRLNHTNMPEEYRQHALIDGQFFYTSPMQLLTQISSEIGETRPEFTNSVWLMECELSQIAGDHSCSVGFWQDFSIAYDLLNFSPLTREQLNSTSLGSERQTTQTLQRLNGRLRTINSIAGGYAGWLMTNAQFRCEADQLFAEFAVPLRRWGTWFIGLNVPDRFEAAGFGPGQDSGWGEYDSAMLSFCIRWRLQGFAAPRLTVPMRPMMSGQFPLPIIEQLMRAGGVFNWPDTFPVFARDELRDLLTDALLQHSPQAHLAGWHRIIASTNRAKNQLVGFARRFRLQHYWRLLRERHPAIFQRNLAKVEIAFANFMRQGEKTIRGDRRDIAAALGKDWDHPRE